MKVLGRIKYDEPEALSDKVIEVRISEDMTHIVVEDQDTGHAVRIPRTVAKEVGRTIVKGQRP